MTTRRKKTIAQFYGVPTSTEVNTSDLDAAIEKNKEVEGKALMSWPKWSLLTSL
jgi:hypothetical protein